jgi:hypothetical protein
LCNLGAYLAHHGSIEEATTVLTEGLPLARDEMGSLSVAVALQHCAVVAAMKGNFERAAGCSANVDACTAAQTHEHAVQVSRRRKGDDAEICRYGTGGIGKRRGRAEGGRWRFRIRPNSAV